jgi:putative glutathione S-transferase
MKLMIDGVWQTGIADTPALRARRAGSGFRDKVKPGAGARYPAAPGRYHLYVSYASPWAHRTLIFRVLKKLEDIIPVSVLHPRWAGPEGWRFKAGSDSTIDHVSGFDTLHEVYRAARPDYTGKVTVPVLWDKATGTIVNNESADIIAMFNAAFDRWGDADVDMYPADLAAEIADLSEEILSEVCSGVYNAGFADSQAGYDRAVEALFGRLETLETRLQRGGPYLFGDRLTVCDWHLFATACRFDAVYHSALKCNLKRLVDFPALSAHTKRLYAMPGIAETVRLDHVKRHYFDDLGLIDPAIVPAGPAVDFRHIKAG